MSSDRIESCFHLLQRREICRLPSQHVLLGHLAPRRRRCISGQTPSASTAAMAIREAQSGERREMHSLSESLSSFRCTFKFHLVDRRRYLGHCCHQ